MGKQSGKPKDQPSYQIRDVVLGKVRGFPPWPGMVVDPDSTPADVLKERPSSKKTPFYCVRFFPTGDYAWLVAKDISKLLKHEIESYINEPFKKSGDLLKGYTIALDPTDWEAEKAALSAITGDEEANAEVDQLESENDDLEEKKTKSKKRKRESDAATKSKPSKSKAKKEPSESAASKKKSTSGGAKGKKNGSKSKALVESEDDGEDQAEAEAEDDEDAGPSKKASPPPTKKAKREKEGEEAEDSVLLSDPEALKVREWRHKLQKTFLSNKGLPKDDDMPALDTLLTTVENYEQMNIDYLLFSKIGKVMRHIAVLPDDKVPKDDEFKFRERAKVLVDRWHHILNASKSNGKDSNTVAAAPAPAAPTSAPAPTNGAVKAEGESQDSEAVTAGTAAIDLNASAAMIVAKEDETPVPATTSQEVEAGDMSALADVTMSEA